MSSNDLFDEDDLLLTQICEMVENENNGNQCAHEDLDDDTLTQLCLEVEKNETVETGHFYVDLNSQYVDEGFMEETKTSFERFGVPVSNEEIKNLVDSQENANTKKNSKWSYGVFEAWRRHRNDISGVDCFPKLAEMTSNQLNSVLGKFVVECRKQDGTPYPPRSLYLIICGLLRHLRNEKVYDKNILDVNNTTFTEFRSILDARMKQLLSFGFGTTTKQAQPLTVEDELVLWEKGVFGDSNAESLQWTVFFYACKLFGLRGHNEHHALQCEQFEIGIDDKGGKFLEFHGRNSKTYSGGLQQKELINKNIRHYCKEGMYMYITISSKQNYYIFT